MDTFMTSKTKKLLESLGETTTPDITTMPVATINKEDSNLADTESKSNTYSPGVTSGVEERALNLLGNGVNAEQVANALGVSPGRISQLLSNEEFAEQVAIKRYQSLQKHNERDEAYDSIEDQLLDKLKRSIGLMVRPDTILKAIQIVNGAKRRGQQSGEASVTNHNIVNLVLPNVIAEQFTVDINNQVIEAGGQELLTMPSNNLLQQVEDADALRIEHAKNHDKETGALSSSQ